MKRKSIQKWGITREVASRAITLNLYINCFIYSLDGLFLKKNKPSHMEFCCCWAHSGNGPAKEPCPSSLPLPSQLQEKASPRSRKVSAAQPTVPAQAGRQGGMLHCGLETGDGEITAAARGCVGSGSSLFLSLWHLSEDSLGFEYTLLRVAVWREKIPRSLRTEVGFELFLKTQLFLT